MRSEITYLFFFAEPCSFSVQRLEECWHEILFVLGFAGLCEVQGKWAHQCSLLSIDLSMAAYWLLWSCQTFVCVLFCDLFVCFSGTCLFAFLDCICILFQDMFVCFLGTCLHAFLGGICVLLQDMLVCFCGRYLHTVPGHVSVLLWEVFAYSSRTCLCDFWDMCFWGYMPVCFSWTDMFICFSGTPVHAFHGQTCSSAFVLFTDRRVHLLFWDTCVCFSQTEMFSCFSGTPLYAFHRQTC